MKKSVLTLAGLAVGGIAIGASSPPPARPNILFLVVDDLNSDVGFLGDDAARTPNLDRLADRSAVFENAHCQAPICGPSRASFLTGKYPHNTGLYGQKPFFRDVAELSDLITLPQHFREHGYTTPAVGKVFHELPDQKSFDPSVGYVDEQNWGWFNGFGPFPEKALNLDVTLPGLPGLPTKPYYDWGAYLKDEETSNYKVAQTAIRLLKESAGSGQPFFISAGFFRPHCPLYAPQRWFDLHPLDTIPVAVDQSDDLTDLPPIALEVVEYQERQVFNRWLLEENRSAGFRQAYRACVSFSDYCAGMVLDALKESGLEQNTIVVLFGDHGVQNGRKNLWFKQTLWEASTRVALVIKLPGQERPLRIEAPVGLIDLYPTLCELAGLPLPDGLDGLSLTGLLTERPGAENRPPALTAYGPGNVALRDEHWRYIRYADGSEELYDHRTDPDEKVNLASKPENAPVIARFQPFVPQTFKPPADGRR
jgi:choline-sulfatase